MREIKFFGSEQETIVKTNKGIFLIKSPDLELEYEELTEIPENFQKLPDTLCVDLIIPEDCI